jgi:hypothetical protein
MSQQRLKHNYGRAFAIALILLLSLGFVLMATSAQRQRFLVEPVTESAGKSLVPMIKVTAIKNNEVYDTVDTENLRYEIQVRGQCPERYRLDQGQFVLDNGRTLVKEPLEVNGDHRSIGTDHGKGWEFFNVNVPFLPAKTAFNPAQTCNQELNRRQGLGQSHAQLLSDGFNIDIPEAYIGKFSVYCKLWDGGLRDSSLNEASVNMPVTIRCMPTGFKPSRTRVEPQRTAVPEPPLESVSVVADPPETQGRQCPVSVTFRGKIVANEKSPYATLNTKYRFVGNNNFTTDWIPVSLTRGETKSVIWRRSIEAPGNDHAGALKTPGGRVTIPVYRGWVLLEVMRPTGTKQSERAAFSVDCNVQPRIRTRQ